MDKTPENGKVTYYVKEKGADETTYKDLTLDELKQLLKGEYTLKAVVEETDNYNKGWVTCNFTVEAAKKKITVTVKLNNWTYGDTPSEPIVAIKDGEEDISDKYSKDDWTVTYYVDSNCETPTTTANSEAQTEGGVPGNAGTYYVKVIVSASDGYKSGEETQKFTIAKANINPTLKDGWTSTWTEGSADITLPEVDNIPENCEVTYWVKGGVYTDYTKISSESDLQKLVPGNYTIKAKVGDTQNYNEGETKLCNFTVEAKKDNPSPSVAPAPTLTPSVQPTESTDGIKINGKDVKSNQKISVSLGTSITITASSKITIVPKAKKSQKKCLKVSVKNNKGTIKVKSLCKNAIKVIITEKSKKTSTTIWINTKVPTPKFKVKINKSRTKFTITIKNKSVAKKIGCYTVEAKNKNTKNKFVYIATDKFKVVTSGGKKYPEGKYSFRITFWNTKKPVKKGKFINKYMHQSQVFNLTVKRK